MNGTPNIVFLFSDQQRWDTLGCYGQRLDITPNLDRMAREGVRFENAFTCQPVCGPARACIQTGKYATETGCHTNGIALPANEKTIAHWFRESGYEVGYIGKWHLATTKGEAEYRDMPIPPERRGGWDDYWLASDALEATSHSYDGYMFDAEGKKREFPEGRFRADTHTDWVIEYLNDRKSEKPFFLFVSYIEPHHQNDHKRYEGPKGSKEMFSDFPVPGDLIDMEGDWKEQMPDYLGCCWSLDNNVGRIRDELEKLGMLENTVIIYTSDHGSHFRTRNRVLENGGDDYKRSCHDACIHIPMIACGPGFTGGKLIDTLVSLIDIPPTILTCGGIEIPDYMKGRALQDLVDGRIEGWPEEVFLQISESRCGRAIRTKKWKYSVQAPGKSGRDPDSDVYVEEFLYDLEHDPHERRNLVTDSDYEYIRTELAEILVRRMHEAGEEIPTILPCKDAGKSSGYPIR